MARLPAEANASPAALGSQAGARGGFSVSGTGRGGVLKALRTALSLLVLALCTGDALLLPSASGAPASSRSKSTKARSWISDAHLSPRNRQRPYRKSTLYIILHTTEGGSKGSIAKLSKNGECNYVVDTDGDVYRIIERGRTAYHAGLSMWNGRTGLDSCSIGIEIVGYHNRDLTAAQYASLKRLLAELKAIYGIRDDRILTHSMVAFGNPNHWQKHRHRGRKRCAMLLALPSVRARMGLYAKPAFDPDVRAGRLKDADPELSTVLYRQGTPVPRPGTPAKTAAKTAAAPAKPAPAAPSTAATAAADAAAAVRAVSSATVIGPGRSAWDIARDAYNAPTTIYTFPNGTRKTGKEITQWKSIPPGTRVEIGIPPSENAPEGLLTIGEDGSAQDLAGDAMLASTTYYFPKKGPYQSGAELSLAAVDALPVGTRMLIGYKVVGPVTPRKPVFSLCGPRWNRSDTYYWDKTGHLVAGDEIGERSIPEGAFVFIKAD